MKEGNLLTILLHMNGVGFASSAVRPSGAACSGPKVTWTDGFSWDTGLSFRDNNDFLRNSYE